MLKMNLDTSQAEIYKLRYKAFESPDSKDANEYDVALIAMLKRGRVLDSREILEGLQIDAKNTEAMKVVSSQLETLRRFCRIKETAHGWKWL